MFKAVVMSFQDGTIVNWSELTQRYKVQNSKGEAASNGGQIVKEWLQQEGVDITRFKRVFASNTEHLRRKKRRGIGGEISVPEDATPDMLRQMAREKVESGEYTLGQRIVPKKVQNIEIQLLLYECILRTDN